MGTAVVIIGVVFTVFVGWFVYEIYNAPMMDPDYDSEFYSDQEIEMIIKNHADQMVSYQSPLNDDVDVYHERALQKQLQEIEDFTDIIEEEWEPEADPTAKCQHGIFLVDECNDCLILADFHFDSAREKGI